jgi:TatD DNase family protein
LIVDSHCHLHDRQFDDDRAAVLARAVAEGVGALVAPATDAASARRALDLARATGELAIGVAVGVHPNDLEAADEWSAIEQLAAEPEVVAIGETGLDYYRGAERAREQRALFSRHLDLAARRRLPVVVHNRAADEDVLAALTDWCADGAGRVAVLHCFVGGPALAERALALGCYLGFGGPLTFKSAADLRESARVAPLERVLVETDAPYLAPAPHRGQRNEPAHARLVAARLAEILELEFGKVAAQTRDNAVRVFGTRLSGAARPLARGLA